MATIVLSAVGASIGGGFGGAFLGMSGAVVGRGIGYLAFRAGLRVGPGICAARLAGYDSAKSGPVPSP